MGKWNRRFGNRRYYQDKPPPPHCLYYTDSYFRGDWRNTRLPWEERFCISVGIPWQKVVVAKKYMHCHDIVVNWNDSASEEAFHDAKKRFWTEINGLACDGPLPDPDMYNGEIDWNPDIDPELIKDLERAYFNPDEAEKADKAEITNRKGPNLGPDLVSGWNEKNHGNNGNPWESSRVQSSGALKDKAEGWSHWGNNSRILENGNNPWVHAQDDQAPKDSLWGGGGNKSWGDGGNKSWGDGAWGGGGNKSWGWNSGINSTRQTTADNNYGNSWGRGGQIAGSYKEMARGEARNNSGSPTRWGTSVNESANPWKNQPSGAPIDRRWRDSGDNSLGWKNWESQNNEPKNFEYRRPNGDGRALNGGCRKREGPPQNTSRYKSSRFQSDDLGISPQWGHQRNQKKVSFV